jgi:hypothetical protein
VHALSVADRWELPRVAEEYIDHNLLDVVFSVVVYVRVGAHHILLNEISQLGVAKVLIPDAKKPRAMNKLNKYKLC